MRDFDKIRVGLQTNTIKTIVLTKEENLSYLKSKKFVVRDIS